MESALRLADGFAYVGASHSLGIIGGKNSHAMAEIGVKFVQRRRGLVQPKFGSWADFFLNAEAQWRREIQCASWFL